MENMFVLLFIFVFCFFFRAAPTAHGSSQVMGPIRAVAASLHLSHSSPELEPHLQPTPQLRETPDP